MKYETFSSIHESTWEIFQPQTITSLTDGKRREVIFFFDFENYWISRIRVPTGQFHVEQLRFWKIEHYDGILSSEIVISVSRSRFSNIGNNDYSMIETFVPHSGNAFGHNLNVLLTSCIVCLHFMGAVFRSFHFAA